MWNPPQTLLDPSYYLEQPEWQRLQRHRIELKSVSFENFKNGDQEFRFYLQVAVLGRQMFAITRNLSKYVKNPDEWGEVSRDDWMRVLKDVPRRILVKYGVGGQALIDTPEGPDDDLVLKVDTRLNMRAVRKLLRGG